MSVTLFVASVSIKAYLLHFFSIALIEVFHIIEQSDMLKGAKTSMQLAWHEPHLTNFIVFQWGEQFTCFFSLQWCIKTGYSGPH